MKKIIYLAMVAASTFILVQSCKKSDSGSNNTDNNTGFDRKAMLTNISTNIIIPSYTAYQTSIVSLDAAVTTFNTTPNATNLTALQNAFIAAYKLWQSASAFNFGPAADVNLGVNTNTYPADVNQINANVTAGSYNPQLLANLAAKGLPTRLFIVWYGCR